MLHTKIEARDWTASVAAQRILATFAKHPPRYRAIAWSDRWTRDDECYSGYRFEALTELRERVAGPILAECDRTRDYTAYNDFVAQPTVDQAITAACNAAVLVTLQDEIEAAGRPYRCMLDTAIEEARA